MLIGMIIAQWSINSSGILTKPGGWGGFSTERMQYLEAHPQEDTYTEGKGEPVRETCEC